MSDIEFITKEVERIPACPCPSTQANYCFGLAFMSMKHGGISAQEFDDLNKRAGWLQAEHWNSLRVAA